MESLSFQDMIRRLQDFWSQNNCAILQPLDLEVGAGTFHPATFLRAVSKEPWNAAYVQASRRPQDGRYGDNPNRLQRYYQFQVVMKPTPSHFQNLYLQSLADLGIQRLEHDIRFLEDDWESPTLGAWGMGWEVWIDGMEISQFTYFQEAGGITVKPVMGEITYGLERLAMFIQGVNNVYELRWNDHLSYADIYHQNEYQQSMYNFNHVNKALQIDLFNHYESECGRLIEKKLPLPAYEMVIKCSHAFNLLDASGGISHTERTAYIARVRKIAKQVAASFYQIREEENFPLQNKKI